MFWYESNKKYSLKNLLIYCLIINQNVVGQNISLTILISGLQTITWQRWYRDESKNREMKNIERLVLKFQNSMFTFFFSISSLCKYLFLVLVLVLVTSLIMPNKCVMPSHQVSRVYLLTSTTFFLTEVDVKDQLIKFVFERKKRYKY